MSNDSKPKRLLAPAQEALIEEIGRHPLFLRAPKVWRVFKELVYSVGRVGAKEIQEYGKDLDSVKSQKRKSRRKVSEPRLVQKQQDAARQAIKDVRDRLKQFYQTSDGKRQSILAEVETLNGYNGGYRVVFRRLEVSVKKFWEPYLGAKPDELSSNLPVLIVYVEPLFYRFSNGVNEPEKPRPTDEEFGLPSDPEQEKERKAYPSSSFLRNQDVNFPDPPAIRSVLQWLPHDCTPSRNYVASGDVQATLVLTRWFERNSVRTEHMLAHNWEFGSVPNQNVILMGNARTFPRICHLLSAAGTNFRIGIHKIVNLQPIDADGEKEAYLDDVDFNGPRMIRGFVARFPIPRKNSHVTIFASNHSRFFEAAARTLTDELEVSLLLDACIVGADDPMPKQFEIFGETELSSLEEFSTNARITWKAKRGFKRTAKDKDSNQVPPAQESERWS